MIGYDTIMDYGKIESVLNHCLDSWLTLCCFEDFAFDSHFQMGVAYEKM